MNRDYDTKMGHTVFVRQFNPQDLLSVVKIDQVAGGNHEPYIFTFFYENYPATFLVAEEGGQVLGVIMGFKQSPLEGRIFWLAVRPDFEGRGIGKQLMIELLNKLRRLGTMRVILEVRVSNKRAQSLYRYLGFEAVAACPDYYPDGEGAIIMRRVL